MNAPRIAPLHAARVSCPSLYEGVPVQLDVDTCAFAVTAAGLFEGRWFERGEVIECRGEPRRGAAVVLVARTQGRPRLGHARSNGFMGDRGEPCSATRWMTAGHVVAVWQRAEEGWSKAPIALDRARLDWGMVAHQVGASVRDLRWPTRGGVGRSPHSPQGTQLSLFVEAA